MLYIYVCLSRVPLYFILACTNVLYELKYTDLIMISVYLIDHIGLCSYRRETICLILVATFLYLHYLV